MTDHVYVIGYPREVGGANTELWHTVKLWRRFGLAVSLIPTWRADPAWQQRLAEIGCTTITPERRTLPVPEGSICVAFCNAHFEKHAPQLRQRDCRLIYLPCMCYVSRTLIKDHERHGPFDRYVFQSHAQFTRILPHLSAFSVKPRHCHLIRGAFDWEEFPHRPRPHCPGEPFVVGRLSRPDADKFSRYTWQLYSDVRRRIPELRVRIMGWAPRVEIQTGLAPQWADVLPQRAESSQQLLASLHVYCQANGNRWDEPRSMENWPRTGLEAMAAGVPIVAERRGGWLEMIEPGETGFLGHTIQEMASYVAQLGEDEALRLRVIRQAYDHLRATLATPEALWAKWQGLFEDLGE